MPPLEKLNTTGQQQQTATDSETLVEIHRLCRVLVAASTRPAHASPDNAPFALSQEEVFAYKGLKNPRFENYPGFQVPLVSVRSCRGVGKDTTERISRKRGRIWDNSNSSRARRAVELLVTEALDHVQTAQDFYDPTNPPPPHPQLYMFSELHMSQACTLPSGVVTPLTVHCDMAVGLLGGVDQSAPYPEVFFPVVLTRGSQTTEEAWPQLVAYLGMIHNAWKEAGVHNAMVYGMCSNGQQYCFAQITNESIACCSGNHEIETNLYGTVVMLCGILRAIQDRAEGRIKMS